MAHNPIEELCDLMSRLELHAAAPALITSVEPPGSATTFFSRQQFFPIMKLPTEVRCMIYEISLQQTIDDIISPPFGIPRLMPAPVCLEVAPTYYVFERVEAKFPPSVGALALLHTSREVRSESTGELIRLLAAHVKALTKHATSFRDDDYNLKEPRFAKLPLFKSHEERRVEAAAEYWEALQDQRVALKMYAYVCIVKLGHLRKMGVEDNHIIESEGDEAPEASSAIGRPDENHMHHVVVSSSDRAIAEYEEFLSKPKNVLVAVERHDSDWCDGSKGVKDHFLWIQFPDVS